MKKYIQHHLIIFALINVCFPLLSSESNWSLKPNSSHKNWFTSKINAFSKKMVTRHSYTHNSFEHMRDMAILHVLPAPIAQGTLSAQRENMKKFLLKNEENALEDVRKHFECDQEQWLKMMSQVKKDHEFNLSEMRKNQKFNTYHDPVVNAFMPEIKNACKKYSINPKSLNLEAQTSRLDWDAEAVSYPPTRGILWDTYNPGTMSFNKESLFNNPLPAGYIDSLVFHELTHIVQGHGARETAILNHQKICTPSGTITNDKQINAYQKYKNSIANKNRIAAQEKTADILLSCSDPEVAKINAYQVQNSTINNGDGTTTILGYPDNFNDMLIINTNWETSQRIEKIQNRLKSIKNKNLQILPQHC